MLKTKVLREIMEIKANEYNCKASKFAESENQILIDEQVPFKMLTFGNNVVIVTTPNLYGDIQQIVGNIEGIFCFDAPQLCALNQVLNTQHYALGEIYDFYVPATVLHAFLERNGDFEIKKIHRSEYAMVDAIDTYENAVCTGDTFHINEFAYAALDGDRVAAIAGVSSNTDMLWWIGVDTVREYRGRGLASYLVHLVARDTLGLQKIPIYPTWFSNIASRITAINAGFRPGFVEIFAIRNQ